MIESALDLLKRTVDSYIHTINNNPILLEQSDRKVYLGNLVDGSGSLLVNGEMAMTLVNIEEEWVGKTMGKVVKYDNPQDKSKGATMYHPDIKLNLFVLFSGHLKNYSNSLLFISQVISCFQSNEAITDASSNDNNDYKIKLIPELYSIPIEQLNYLWNILGTKYVPSVLYKIRMVKIQSAEQLPETKLIKTTQIDKQVGNNVLPPFIKVEE